MRGQIVMGASVSGRQSGFHPENGSSILPVPTKMKVAGKYRRTLFYTDSTSEKYGICFGRCHKCKHRFVCYTLDSEELLEMSSRTAYCEISYEVTRSRL